jgi:dTDP-4-amino-4,6-dideoxy-D-galactose acyltransferase
MALMTFGSSKQDVHACRILEWDSAFFGHRIARFQGLRCRSEELAAAIAECRARQIDCVYILVGVADTDSIRALQDGRAYLADVRMTLGAGIDAAIGSAAPPEGAARVRPAREPDIPALARIASVSHRDTRFYADGHFAAEQCDRLYQVWIEKSCHGDADAVLVAEDEARQPIGYVTCHGKGQPAGRIGLMAVNEDARGGGVGSALLRGAFAWFAANGVASVTVATQLRNVGALRFYGRAGLLIGSVDLWFHLWPRDVHA